mmetsp:Transcript_122943/g.244587  ORF Transcript_122943/g.244587 Transcript_122943/m.244587 type:complete len:205 (-) Transcript_122943:64-678(-)
MVAVVGNVRQPRRQARLAAILLAAFGISAVNLSCLGGKSEWTAFVQAPSVMLHRAAAVDDSVAESSSQPRSQVAMCAHVRVPDYYNFQARQRSKPHQFDEDGGLYDIIRYPVLTEKACQRIEAFNTYTFLVDRHANKPQIKAAIETIFKVKVLKANVSIPPAKYTVRYGFRVGRKSVYKKAFVKLMEGYSIDLFPDDPEKVEGA